MLNMRQDGSFILDAKGSPEATYDNDEPQQVHKRASKTSFKRGLGLRGFSFLEGLGFRVGGAELVRLTIGFGGSDFGLLKEEVLHYLQFHKPKEMHQSRRDSRQPNTPLLRNTP